MYHPSFIQFLSYFNGNHDYFECHEVLEDYWKDVAPRDRQHPLTGWIQLATGMYHWRRGNFRGATTILKKGCTTLQASAHSLYLEKVDYETLLKQLSSIRLAVEKQMPFEPFTIAISDDALQQKVEQSIAQLPTTDVHFIKHKHRLRDRTEVIADRHAAIEKRQLDTKRSRHQ